MIEYTKEELELFERIMRKEFRFRDTGLCTNSEKAELPILKSLISKITKTIAVARQHGLIKTPKKEEIKNGQTK